MSQTFLALAYSALCFAPLALPALVLHGAGLRLDRRA